MSPDQKRYLLALPVDEDERGRLKARLAGVRARLN
jgi:hypothetical protein